MIPSIRGACVASLRAAQRLVQSRATYTAATVVGELLECMSLASAQALARDVVRYLDAIEAEEKQPPIEDGPETETEEETAEQ
jgi:hypothetical protein